MDYKKQMFQAICDKCGQPCEVPFKPTSGKPVLCSTCFGHQRSKDQGRSGDRNKRSFDRQGRSGDRQMHQATCDKCGQPCEVPFKPTAGKPIYCNNCFSKKSGSKDSRRGGGGGGNEQLSQQLKSLSNKLDKILNLLESGRTTKETAAKTAPKKPIVPKKTAKKTARKKK